MKAHELYRPGQPTSKEAAEAIYNTLAEKRKRALFFVEFHPGKTANELSNIAGDRDPRTIGRRLNELEKIGLIHRAGKRPCSTTGKTTYIWKIGRKEPEAK